MNDKENELLVTFRTEFTVDPGVSSFDHLHLMLSPGAVSSCRRVLHRSPRGGGYFDSCLGIGVPLRV